MLPLFLSAVWLTDITSEEALSLRGYCLPSLISRSGAIDLINSPSCILSIDDQISEIIGVLIYNHERHFSLSSI